MQKEIGENIGALPAGSMQKAGGLTVSGNRPHENPSKEIVSLHALQKKRTSA